MDEQRASVIPVHEENEQIKEGVKSALNSIFPILGKKNELHLKDLEIDEVEADPYNIKAQYDARMLGRTYAAPFHANLQLKDKETGKVVQTAKIKMGNIPLVTHRGSYIIDGNEYYTSSIVRKKPGMYARISENGIPFVEVNSGKGRNMKLNLNDDGILNLDIAGKNIPILPLLRSIGTSDEEIKKALGEKIFVENLKKSHLQESAVNKAHAAMYYDAKPKSIEDGVEKIKFYLDNSTEFMPEVNQITLGKPFTKLTPEALLAAATKLIKLRKKEIEPDDSEHLAFKTFHSTSDLMKERLEKLSKQIKYKWVRNVDKGDTIGKVMGAAPFDSFMHSLFTEFPNINLGEQSNPLSYITNFHRTTVFGPGAINDEHAVTKENKNVSISQMGFMDVFHTPEKQAGLVNQITPGTIKKGTTLYKHVLNREGKASLISPVDMLDKSVAFPDQIKFEDGKLLPHDAKNVTAVKGGKIVSLPWKEIDYVIPNHAMYFDQATNMIPFLNSDHGNRSYMAGKHMEQSLPLKYREEPLVQTNMLNDKVKPLSMEEMIGTDFSTKSPVAGTVAKIDKANMVITIKGADGKEHKLPIYNNFHLNGGGFINSEPQKKEGDSVKAGEIVADTNFTRDGKLALGVNMNVAYMPYKGYNFEDGLVISESAAKRFTSEHTYEESLTPDQEDIVDKKKFIAFSPTMFSSTQLDKLGDDGVAKQGMIIEPGDPLVLHLKKKVISTESNMLGRISKALNMPYKINPLVWEGSVSAEVIGVSRVGETIKVVLKTEEPAIVGDKLAGRHGNKGVITQIVPDAQMPKTVSGGALDVLYSPVYILGRTNIGQLMEIAAGKIAKKTGKPYFVQNFEKANYAEKLTKELKQNGLMDKESVFDPTNGKTYHAIALGPEYMVKMHHQVEHKMAARYPDKYDANLQPIKGGEHSASAIDRLTFNALLAHGARHNLFEAGAYKAEKNDEFWRAFESNRTLPSPKAPFVFNKLLAMIQAMGINVKKDGSKFQLMPATSKDVLSWSSGELTNPLGYRGKDLAEIEGGIFDPKITGGMKGERWSHITLAEPIPNPMFADAIRKLTKLSGDQIDDLIAGKLKLDNKMELVKEGPGLIGGAAIRKMLSKIDIDKRAEELAAAARVAKGDSLNSINQEARYVEALKRTGLKPQDAYVLDQIPVIPPIMRPVYPGNDGKTIISPINHIYRFLIEGNLQLKDMKGLPDEVKQDLRKDIFNNTAALIGLKAPTVRMPSRDYKGLLEIISGTDQPKHGFFHSKLMSKRQDLAGRSVIALNNEIHPDEIGLPLEIAWDLFRPFTIRKLVQMGNTPLDASKKVDERSNIALQALTQELKERPVLMNRAPSLHKHSIMAFRAVPVHQKTIQLNPLVVTGFNADFDGDAMQVYVPTLEAAKEEAFGMMPSKHLTNQGREGIDLMLVPKREASGGLWYASYKENKTDKKYKTNAEAVADYEKHAIELSDIITVNGEETTVGRIRLREIVPKDVQFDNLDKAGQSKLLKAIYEKHKDTYAGIVDKLNKFGNDVAPEGKLSFGVSDLNLPWMRTERDKIISSAMKNVKDRSDSGELTKALGDKTREAIMDLQKQIPMNNALKRLQVAGMDKGVNVKGQSMTYLQLVGAPLLIEDIKKRVIPVAIGKSYAEGLELSEYLATSFGSRQGMADKASSTADPGAFQKELINTVQSTLIAIDDCGTKNGIEAGVDDPDTVDRYLAADIPGVGRRNEVITPVMLSAAKKKNMTTIKARSPLSCEAKTGVCQKCVGLNENGKDWSLGTNIGVIAAHAMGEPLVQMAMKSFHQGGVYGSATIANAFPMINQVLQVPKVYVGATALSEHEGKVEKVEKDILGNWIVTVGGTKHTVPVGQKLLVGTGDKVQKGDSLGEGLRNPRDVLKLLGTHPARMQMVEDLKGIYSQGGAKIKRRMIETVVKASTDTTRVIDPGTSAFSPGDYARLSSVDNYNKTPYENVAASEALNKITYESLPGIPSGTKLTKDHIDKLERLGHNIIKAKKDKIQHEPSLYGAAFVPLYFEEDWLARLGATRLKDAIREGAAFAQTANLHSTNPVPAWAAGYEFGKSDDKIKY